MKQYYKDIINTEDKIIQENHKKLDEKIKKEGLPQLIPLKNSNSDKLISANRQNTDFYYHANYIYEIKENYIVQDKKKIIFSDDYIIDKFNDVHRDFNIVNNEKVIHKAKYKYEEIISAMKLDEKVFIINRVECDAIIGLYYSNDGINFHEFKTVDNNNELKEAISKDIQFIFTFYNIELEHNLKPSYNISNLENLFEFCTRTALIIEDDDYDNVGNMRYKIISQQGSPPCIFQSNDLITWHNCIDDEKGKIIKIQDINKNYNNLPDFNHKYIGFTVKSIQSYWEKCIKSVGPLGWEERGDCHMPLVKSLKNKNEYIICLRRPFEIKYSQGGPQRRLRFLKNSNFKENPTSGWYFVDNLDLFLNPQPYEMRISLIDEIYYGVVNRFANIYYPYLSTSRDGIYYDVRYFLDIPIRSIDKNNKYIKGYNLVNIKNKNFFYFSKSNLNDCIYSKGSPTHLPIYASEIDLDRTFYIRNNEEKVGFIKTKNLILKSDNIKIIFEKISEDIILNYKVYKDNGEEITNNLSNSLNDECYLEIVFMNIKLYGFEFI